jgi:dolichol-phosphate mannosyltransferase
MFMKKGKTESHLRASVVVPTLNEGKTIGATLPLLFASGNFAEALIVDDGSSDNTQQEVERFTAKGARFIDRSKEPAHGLTASVLDGIREAKAEFIIVMDGDGQHPPEKAAELAAKLLDGNDLVVAYRTSVPGWPIARRIISKGAELLARMRLLATGKPCPKDPLSGFFGIRRSLALEIMQKAKFEPKGYKVLFDMLKSAPKNIKIGEVGYVFRTRKGGESKIGLRHILLFFKSVFT